jgi:hypothetical protein
MVFRRSNHLLCILLVIALFDFALADENSEDSGPATESLTDDISFSGQWFIAYDIDENDEGTTNAFTLKRGYATVKKTFTDELSARITQDIAVDREGDGEGDIELRLKYLYLKYRLNDMAFFTDPSFEFGLVHRPWLDFEQKINLYRVQGTMFLERYKILRSADYGITFSSLFGGTMDEVYRSEVNKSYPGRYGSLSIGVYNGGGYEALENNDNKLIESRLSIRPLPELLPGTQLSWLFGIGKGNTVESPKLHYNAGFLSIEHRLYVLTLTYYAGTGDVNGTLVDEAGNALSLNGYSAFGEFKFIVPRLSAILRYDKFECDHAVAGWTKERFIAGLSYRFHGKSRVLIDYDYLKHTSDRQETSAMFEIAIEINY